MPEYVIGREIPGAGNLKPEELKAISQKSCGVLKNLGPQIQWVESFVTQNKIYCVYIAPNEKMVREHASQGGFLPTKFLRSKQQSIPQRRSRSANSYGFPAIPCTSKRASNSNLPEPKNARAGNSLLKYVR
jgi:hypothetical protein